MKNLFLLLLFVPVYGIAQNCSSCTQTINTTSSTTITVNPGDVVCITNTGVMNGNIIMNGGIVCNDGIIQSDITVNDGTFSNYGTITGSGHFISHDKGVFNNYGTINNGSFSAVGNTIQVNNYGRIETGSVNLDSMNNGTRPVFLNEGIIYTTSLTIERSDFTNNDSITLTGNLVVGVRGYFLNDAAMVVGGNCNIGTVDAYVQTNCVIQVNGNWVNAGTVNGPLSSCGGFYVNGFASNSSTGKIGMDNSYIDVCEQGNSNGLLNSGSLGTNMTQCSCSNTCTVFTGIDEFNSKEMNLYPNPANNYLTIDGLSNEQILKIYDFTGKLFYTVPSESNSLNIDISKWKNGIYLIQADEKTIKFIKN